MKKPFFYAFSLVPLLSYSMSFQTLCDHAYKASGEIIQTNGRLLSNTHEKASALAYEPLLFEGSASSINGKDPQDSGILYGGMINVPFKRPGLQRAMENQYDQNSKTLQQEVQLQQRLIQVSLKRDWLITMLEQERVEVLREKASFASEAYTLGEKKLRAGRMSQMELMRFQGEMRTAAQELAQGEMEFEHAQHALQESTMLHDTIIVDDLSFAFITDDNRSEDRINNAGVLLSLNAQISALDAQMKSAYFEGAESISMGVGATREPTQNSIDFAITIPLSLSEKNDKKIAALMAEKSALIHRREVTHQKLKMNIHTLLEHLETREKHYHKAITSLKEQKKLMEMTHRGYDGGILGAFEYLSTKNNYYDTWLRTLELKREYILEMSSIEEKLGRIWE